MGDFVNRKVTPSYIGSQSMGMSEEPSTHGNAFQLMLGEIKEIIEPDDDRSLSKLYMEYHVDVQYREGSGPLSVVRFPNCQIMNLFGGTADVFRYTLRPDSKEPDQKKVSTTGSKVLVLCLNGNGGLAYIVGGVREDQVADKKDDGHNLWLEFNGISFRINKDGEARVQFRGPTKIDGKLDGDAGGDEKKGPTTVEFLKNGNLKIYTKDDKQHLLLDHENKKADFLFDEEWKVKVNKKVTEDYGDAWECSVGASIKITAKDTTTIDCGSNKMYLKSGGVQTGSATDATILGDTYRKGESQMNNSLKQQLNTLTGLIQTITQAVNGPMSIPLYGAAIASKIIGPALAQVGQAITTMGSAIDSFESSASTYLSSKNKSD